MAEEKKKANQQSQKKLTQEEVDLFLQWSDIDEKDLEQDQEKIQEKALFVSTHRKFDPKYLSVLEEIFSHSTRHLVTGLRNFMTENVDVILKSVKSDLFSDYLDSIKIPSLMCVFNVKEWNGLGLMVVENELVYSLIEILMGGKNKELHACEKSYTNIERNIIRKFSHVVLEILTNSFSHITEVHFDLERIETEPRFINITHEEHVIFSASFLLFLDEKESGYMHIVLPLTTVEPVKNVFFQHFSAVKNDVLWKKHVSEELNLATINLTASIPHNTFYLSEILKWKEGEQIVFNFQKDEKVNLTSENAVVFSGHIGQKSGLMAIRIDDVFLNNQKEDDHDVN